MDFGVLYKMDVDLSEDFNEAVPFIRPQRQQLNLTRGGSARRGGRARSTPYTRVGEKGESNGKKHYDQRYLDEWENEFIWVQEDPNNEYKAICFVCGSKLMAKHDILVKHGLGKKHRERVAQYW